GELRAAPAGGCALFSRPRGQAPRRRPHHAGSGAARLPPPRSPHPGRCTGGRRVGRDPAGNPGADGDAMAGPPRPGCNEVAAYLALAQVPGIGAARLRTLIAAFESASAALHAPHGAIAALPGFSRAAAGAIRAVSPAAGHEILNQLERLGAAVLLPDDPGFPPLLSEIPEPPALLYVWGDVAWLTRPAVRIVGSRAHTPYGADAARLLAAGVARAGVVVASGLARGIDAIAHAAALDAGGASVGVL